MSVSAFTVGGVIIDNMVAADGSVERGLVGGNAIYSAIGASLWLNDVGICGRIPQNYPPVSRDLINRSGVDTSGLTVESASVSRSEWFFHRVDGSRADHLHATDEEADQFGMTETPVSPAQSERFQHALRTRRSTGDDFAGFRHAHPVTAAGIPGSFWEAMGVHLAPNQPEAQLAIARKARAKGMFITWDPGFHAASLPRSLLDDMLKLCDAFLPSQKELDLICPGMRPEQALGELSSRARGAVGVKRGAAGSLILARGARAITAVGVHPARVVDPTGAGDAFCGGFLAGLVLGDNPVCAAMRGSVSASFAVEQAGALPAKATAADAQRRLATLISAHDTTTQQATT